MTSYPPVESETQKRKVPEEEGNTSTFMPVLVFVVIAVCFVTVLGAAQAESARSMQNFVQTASAANEFEIESSRLALQKSQNDDVRQFAQHMINDHTKAGDGLVAAVAASNSGMQVPSPALDMKHQKIMNRLNAADGHDFDVQYINAQISAHDDAVSLFDSYARYGRDTSVKNFAAQTLSTLEEHKKDVYQLKSSI